MKQVHLKNCLNYDCTSVVFINSVQDAIIARNSSPYILRINSEFLILAFCDSSKYVCQK